MSLGDILLLIDACRVEPDACAVLHDALLEEYGYAYGKWVEVAISSARQWRSGRRRDDRRQAYVVVVEPVRLRARELLGSPNLAALDELARLTQQYFASLPFRVLSDRIGWRNELETWGDHLTWRQAVPTFRAVPPERRTR